LAFPLKGTVGRKLAGGITEGNRKRLLAGICVFNTLVQIEIEYADGLWFESKDAH
jgi:hypothetical protein